MGSLLYGNDTVGVEFDDRTLAHLKVVVVGKLRRHESFSLSWVRPLSMGSGGETIWLSPAIPLRFRFDGPQTAALNREWLQALSASADRGELRLTPEPR